MAPSAECYKVRAGVVCLQVKLCDSHLSALKVRFSRLPLTFAFVVCGSNTVNIRRTMVVAIGCSNDRCIHAVSVLVYSDSRRPMAYV